MVYASFDFRDIEVKRYVPEILEMHENLREIFRS